VTKEELYSNLSKEMADYCVARMKPYEDPRTGQSITGGAGLYENPFFFQGFGSALI
jgi:spectrin alpha